MADYNKLIEELFAKDESIIDSDKLNNIIAEVSQQLTTEAKKQQPLPTTQDLQKEKIKREIFKLLPKFEFRETSLGIMTSEARQEFRSFFSTKFGEQHTLRQKVDFINKFCNQKPDPNNVSNFDDILSTLTVLKILESIIVESSPSAGGLQYESLIAAMFSSGEQIKQGEGENGSVDIIVNNLRYQVKLIKKGGEVKIAFSNTEEFFSKHNKLGFIITEKTNERTLLFYQYFLTKENYELYKTKIMQKNADKLDAVASALKPVDKPVDKQLSLNLEAEQEKTYDFNKYDMKDLFQGGFKLPKEAYRKQKLGEISVHPDIFIKYSVMLQGSIKVVLENLADLMDNVNKFYIKKDVNASMAAKNNADNIKNNL